MTDGAFSRFVGEDDQGVDRDAGLRVEKKRIDVDRGDPALRVRHQVRQPDQRLHNGSFVQRGLAAIASKFHTGLGAADQRFGLGGIEWRAGDRDVLHQFDIDAAGPEHYGRPHFGVEHGPDDKLKLAPDLLRDQDAFELRLVLQLLHPRGDLVEGFADRSRIFDVQYDTADTGFVQDIRADDLGDDGKADLFGNLDGFRCAVRNLFLRDRNAVGLQELF